MRRLVLCLAWAACNPGGVPAEPEPFALDAAESWRVPQAPFAIAAGDFDGDGLSDVALVYRDSYVPDGTERLTIRLRQAEGGWREVADQAEPFAAAVLAADFDGDGKAEVLSVGERAALYDGAGRLVQASDLGDAFPTGAALGDFDGNGRPEVAVIQEDGVLLLGNDLAARELLPFSPGPLAGGGVTTGDLDGDGRLDLVAWSHDTGAARTFHNLASGFQAWHDLPGDGGLSGDLVVADVEGDASLDLLRASITDGGIAVFQGSGGKGFSPTRKLFNGKAIYGLRAVDLGEPHLAVSLASDNALVLLRRDGEESARYGAGVMPTLIDSGDFGGDGRRDLLVLNGSGVASARPNSINVLHGRGDGTLRAAPARYLDSGNADTLMIADLDGNGRPEVVIASDRYSVLTVVDGDKQATLVGNRFSEGVGLGHFSGQPGWDLATIVESNRNLYWAPGWNAVDPPELQERKINLRGDQLKVADLDGDGRDELILSSVADGQLTVVKDPLGGVQKKSLPVDARQLVVGALDGKPQILVSTGAGEILAVDPEPLAVARTLVSGLPLGAPLAIGDVDGDGAADLASADAQHGELTVHFGPDFARAQSWASGGEALALAIADVDGDGKNEVLIGTWYNLVTIHRR